MDNAESQAPKPLAMSDDELERALEQAKQSSDGLVAAMILLEQQEQLRRADAAALADWKQRQPSAVSLTIENDTVALVDKQDISSAVADKDEQSQSIHSQTPEIVAERPEDFEVILSEAIAEATSAVDTIESSEAISTVSHSDDDEEVDTGYIPMSATDLAVTGTLNQIVESVNRNFDSSASEDLTAEEENSAVSNDEPLPSNAIKIVTEPKAKRSASAGAMFSKLPFVEYLVAAIVPILAVGTGVDVSTVTLSVAIGMLLHASIALMFRVNESRGSKSSEFLMRSTYGVWGAHFPQSLLVLARVVLSGALVSWLLGSLNKTTQLGDLGLDVSLVPGLVDGGQVLASAVALIVAIISFSNRAVTAMKVVSTFSVTGVLLFAVATLPGATFTGPDLGVSIGLGVAYAICVGMLFRQNSLSEGPLKKLGPELLEISTTRVVPAGLVAMMSAIAAFSPVISAALTGSGNPVAELNRIASSGFATTINVAVAVAVVTLVASQANSVVLSIGSFNMSSAVLTKALVALLFVLGAVASPLLEFTPASALSSLLLGTTAIALTPYLTEALYRRSNFHEVSLMRAYAFYKRVAIAAVSGNLVFLLLLAASVIPNGLLQGSAPVWFGTLTPLVLVVAGVKVWTLVTALPRVRGQEAELKLVEIRRNELAGLDYIS